VCLRPRCPEALAGLPEEAARRAAEAHRDAPGSPPPGRASQRLRRAGRAAPRRSGAESPRGPEARGSRQGSLLHRRGRDRRLRDRHPPPLTVPARVQDPGATLAFRQVAPCGSARTPSSVCARRGDLAESATADRRAGKGTHDNRCSLFRMIWTSSKLVLTRHSRSWRDSDPWDERADERHTSQCQGVFLLATQSDSDTNVPGRLSLYYS